MTLGFWNDGTYAGDFARSLFARRAEVPFYPQATAAPASKLDVLSSDHWRATRTVKRFMGI